MTTLTIHLENPDQETAVRLFLEALHVKYVSSQTENETVYLQSSPAMVDHLKKAAEQEQRGEGVKIALDDIWK